MRSELSLVFRGLWILLLSSTAWAQAISTAQINGTVRDQAGLALPGVTVSVTQTDTGLTRTTVTGDTGSYVPQNLPIGPYRLDAALQGFRTYSQTGIVLQVGANPTLAVTLDVGQIEETVEACFQQRPQSPLEFFQILSARILAGEQFSRDDPVRISEGLGEIRHQGL